MSTFLSTSARDTRASSSSSSDDSSAHLDWDSDEEWSSDEDSNEETCQCIGDENGNVRSAAYALFVALALCYVFITE